MSSTLFAKAKKTKHKEPTSVPFSLIRLDMLGNQAQTRDFYILGPLRILFIYNYFLWK